MKSWHSNLYRIKCFDNWFGIWCLRCFLFKPWFWILILNFAGNSIHRLSRYLYMDGDWEDILLPISKYEQLNSLFNVIHCIVTCHNSQAHISTRIQFVNIFIDVTFSDVLLTTRCKKQKMRKRSRKEKTWVNSFTQSSSYDFIWQESII